MLIAELYKQTGCGRHTGRDLADGRREGLALAIEILKRHKAGSTSMQIALDCGCSLGDVEAIIRNI